MSRHDGSAGTRTGRYAMWPCIYKGCVSPCGVWLCKSACTMCLLGCPRWQSAISRQVYLRGRAAVRPYKMGPTSIHACHLPHVPDLAGRDKGMRDAKAMIPPGAMAG